MPHPQWLHMPVRPVTFRPGRRMRPGTLPLERLTLREGDVIPQVEVWRRKRNKLAYRKRPRHWRPRSRLRYRDFGYGLTFTVAATRRRKPGPYRPLRQPVPDELYDPDFRA
jgi:hypothetical protein